MYARRPRLLWGTSVVAILATVVATASASALNGTQAPAQLSFVAKINVGEQSACTGALVAPQWVLTASSCFSSDGARPSVSRRSPPPSLSAASISHTLAAVSSRPLTSCRTPTATSLWYGSRRPSPTRS
ncbi:MULTISPECIES: trypsin-like serine protease [unclassified Streptomyces]|uniref:trypsin-like serine protease n=1 Tax=unclassified Streptomyces TaxID=2593676 RepID=UPI0033A84F32